MIKAKDGEEVRVGNWLLMENGEIFEVLWIDSRGFGLRAVRLDITPGIVEKVRTTADIRLFDDDQVAAMQLIKNLKERGIINHDNKKSYSDFGPGEPDH